jgi:hypothetical protein
MFSLGPSATLDLCADPCPFPFITTSPLGAGEGVAGLDTAAACLRVLTLDTDDMILNLLRLAAVNQWGVLMLLSRVSLVSTKVAISRLLICLRVDVEMCLQSEIKVFDCESGKLEIKRH